MVLQLLADRVEQRAMQCRFPEKFIEAGRFSNEEEHRRPAEKIEGHQPVLDSQRLPGVLVHISHPHFFPSQSVTPCAYLARIQVLGHLEAEAAQVAPRPANVAGRLYPTDAYNVNCPLGGGMGVIWNGNPLNPPVIPAKAGSQSDYSSLPKPCGVDSRFSGNDCAPNETTKWAAATVLYWVRNGPGTLIRSARVWPPFVIRAKV